MAKPSEAAIIEKRIAFTSLERYPGKKFLEMLIKVMIPLPEEGPNTTKSMVYDQHIQTLRKAYEHVIEAAKSIEQQHRQCLEKRKEEEIKKNTPSAQYGGEDKEKTPASTRSQWDKKSHHPQPPGRMPPCSQQSPAGGGSDSQRTQYGAGYTRPQGYEAMGATPMTTRTTCNSPNANIPWRQGGPSGGNGSVVAPMYSQTMAAGRAPGATSMSRRTASPDTRSPSRRFGEQNTRGMDGYPSTTSSHTLFGPGSEMVEDVVARFDTLEESAQTRVKRTTGQQLALNESLAALQKETDTSGTLS